jgi:hypothetical protein
MTLLLENIKKSIPNILGWHTKRKIIVIESDDWGSIRMRDYETRNKLKSSGILIDKCPFNKYDSLASEKDLDSLFNVLSDFRDSNSNPPVITANCVLVNPDFEKIRASDFSEYYYETFIETLKKYPNHANSFGLWQQGMESKLFHPEYHGREHLQVSRWMKALQQGLPETMFAFNNKVFGLSSDIVKEKRRSYMAAFDIDVKEDLHNVKYIIADGMSLFIRIFGYHPSSFIAPNYVWPTEIESHLSSLKIKYLKGRTTQISPVPAPGNIKRIRHYTGQTNKWNQIHLIRNCYFEPSFNDCSDPVNKCLDEISRAFKWRKPAIICSHRVNFIGSIEQSNRDNNLRDLHRLFTEIKRRWPNVEYMNAEQLGDLISISKCIDD